LSGLVAGAGAAKTFRVAEPGIIGGWPHPGSNNAKLKATNNLFVSNSAAHFGRNTAIA
jgi:hypothetical protein